jgi:hypothetical protein
VLCPEVSGGEPMVKRNMCGACLECVKVHAASQGCWEFVNVAGLGCGQRRLARGLLVGVFKKS